MFLRELNIEYEDKYYAYDDTWPGINKSQGISITGTLPVLEIDGQRLYQVKAHLCSSCLLDSSSQNVPSMLTIEGYC